MKKKQKQPVVRKPDEFSETIYMPRTRGWIYASGKMTQIPREADEVGVYKLVAVKKLKVELA